MNGNCIKFKNIGVPPYTEKLECDRFRIVPFNGAKLKSIKETN